jgi:hypothetical protein
MSFNVLNINDRASSGASDRPVSVSDILCACADILGISHEQFQEK